MVLSIQNQRESEAFCGRVLERPAIAADPRFADNPARVQNRPALDAEIHRPDEEITLGPVPAAGEHRAAVRAEFG